MPEPHFFRSLLIGTLGSLIASVIIILSWDLHRTQFLVGSRRHDIMELNRQAYRWYIASKQDSHPMVKIVHANYAVGYVDALRAIATDDVINDVTGLDIDRLSHAATHEQDLALVMMAKKCPGLIPDDGVYRDYLGKFLTSSVSDSGTSQR